jgi:hypothetical protein
MSHQRAGKSVSQTGRKLECLRSGELSDHSQTFHQFRRGEIGLYDYLDACVEELARLHKIDRILTEPRRAFLREWYRDELRADPALVEFIASRGDASESGRSQRQ